MKHGSLKAAVERFIKTGEPYAPLCGKPLSSKHAPNGTDECMEPKDHTGPCRGFWEPLAQSES